jgi:hypothetical protein
MHPNAKLVHSAAEAYMLPSHAAFGSPIIRNGDNDSTTSFMQGRRVPIGATWIFKPVFDPNSDKPLDMYPGGIERYYHAHLFNLSDSEIKTRNFMVGNMQLQAHNGNFGTFYTTTDGILIAPPGDSLLFAQKLTPMMKKTPVAFGGGDPDKHFGIPVSARIFTSQHACPVVGHDNNPYHWQHGAYCELQPSPESHTNEQFLTALNKVTEPYHKRGEVLADQTWMYQKDQKYMEPNIPTGFSERAKHCQGIRTSGAATDTSAIAPAAAILETPVTVTLPSTRKTVEGTMIKPGLRGGGDATMPSYVMNTVHLDPKAESPATKHDALDCGCKNYSHLHGILLKPEHDIYKQRPYVTLTDGTFEPILPAKTLRRIANKITKGARPVQLFGGYFGPVASTNNWHSTPRYTCSMCNSLYHGLKDCPALYIKGGKINCMHCGKDGHILADCPYPLQLLLTRTQVQSICLYTGTLHFKISVLVWEFEHDVIGEEKFLDLREKMIKDSLQGEVSHAFATIGCPMCQTSDHEGAIHAAIESIANRFRERGGVEEEKLALKEFMYDLRRCPLYWFIYNKHFPNIEFFAYNPLKVIAVDALYRMFIRASAVSLTFIHCSISY